MAPPPALRHTQHVKKLWLLNERSSDRATVATCSLAVSMTIKGSLRAEDCLYIFGRWLSEHLRSATADIWNSEIRRPDAGNLVETLQSCSTHGFAVYCECFGGNLSQEFDGPFGEDVSKHGCKCSLVLVFTCKILIHYWRVRALNVTAKDGRKVFHKLYFYSHRRSYWHMSGGQFDRLTCGSMNSYSSVFTIINSFTWYASSSIRATS